jgi:hypothetical protein
MISIKNIPIYACGLAIILLITTFTNAFGFFVSPVALTGVVLAFCILLLNRVEPNLVYKKPKYQTIPIVIFVAANILIITFVYTIYANNPIDVKQSDILPLIHDIYFTRLATGQDVYAAIEGYGYGNWYPNYLPMHWLPFVPAYIIGFDPRLISLGVFLVANGFYFFALLKFNLHPAEAIVKVLLPFAILLLVCLYQPTEIAHTVELLICGYYVMLAVLLLTHSSGVTKGFVLMFTTLSRYVVVFILPALLLTDITYKRKDWWLVYFLFVFLIVVFYIAPFLRDDPLVFFKALKAYDTAALGEWGGQSWQKPGDLPFQLFRGLGFASWFYLFAKGELIDKIALLKIVLLAIMAVNLLIWLFAAQWVKVKYMLQPVMLFFTLYVFFAFVLVPYNYLFWNVVFLVPVMLLPVKLVKS